MKLNFNDTQIVLEPYNTNFVDRWMNWVFDSSNTLRLNFDDVAVQQQYTQWLENVDNLNRLLDMVNRIAINDGMSPEWIYDKSESVDSNFLQETHEKWADITKKSCEQHLLIFNPETKEIYESINKKLSEVSMCYNDINNCVHKIEFQYRFFAMHRLTFNLSTEKINDYIITAEDTSFIKDTIVIPFNDIGRPQYEKYCISGSVIHPEISNYQNIVNAVEIQSSPAPQYCHKSYIEKCTSDGIPLYGPYVSILLLEAIQTYGPYN